MIKCLSEQEVMSSQMDVLLLFVICTLATLLTMLLAKFRPISTGNRALAIVLFLRDYFLAMLEDGLDKDVDAFDFIPVLRLNARFDPLNLRIHHLDFMPIVIFEAVLRFLLL